MEHDNLQDFYDFCECDAHGYMAHLEAEYWDNLIDAKEQGE